MRHDDLKKCISHIPFTFSTYLFKKHELKHGPTPNHSTFQHLQALILLILLFVRQWTHQDNTWMLLQILFIRSVNILITVLSFDRFKKKNPTTFINEYIVLLACVPMLCEPQGCRQEGERLRAPSSNAAASEGQVSEGGGRSGSALNARGLKKTILGPCPGGQHANSNPWVKGVKRINVLITLAAHDWNGARLHATWGFYI